jgi:murein hydrolase activator
MLAVAVCGAMSGMATAQAVAGESIAPDATIELLPRVEAADPVLAGVGTGATAPAADPQRQSEALSADVSSLEAEREKLNISLMQTAATIQSSEAQLTAIESRILEQEAREKSLRASLAGSHGQVAKLLGALQRMGRNPPPVLVTRRQDALEMVRSAMLLASAFPELKDQALELARKLDDLTQLMTSTKAEYARLKTETERLTEMQGRLTGLLEVKKMTIAERQLELAAVRKASAEISAGANNLNDLISRLDETVTEKTGLGAYDAELKSAPASVGAADQGPSAAEPARPVEVAAAIPPPQSRPVVVELAPTGAAMMPGSAARMKPSMPFSQARGKLSLPAHGKRVLEFGGKTQFGGQSKGIVIETRQGAQITSPCDGWVVWAGEFRSYGQLLIINAGDGYHILLAGLSQIDVEPGQFILAAEPVGTMSGGGRASMASLDAGSPVLYVEFRKDGRPINPDPWWVTGQQKVQG